MKRLIALTLCLLMLTGCGSAPEAPETTPMAPVVTDPVPEQTQETVALPDPTVIPETEPAETEPQPVELTLYTPNDSVDGFVKSVTEIPELTTEAIFDALIGAGVLNEGVSVNSMEIDGVNIKLDVNEAFRDQLCTYGTSGEYVMIGSVVNTLLDAYDLVSVTITMNGGIIESGHVIYDFPLEFHS